MVDTTGSCGCVMCWLHRTKTAPAWPKAVESVTLEAVGPNTRGPISLSLSRWGRRATRAARRALRSRAREPRGSCSQAAVKLQVAWWPSRAGPGCL